MYAPNEAGDEVQIGYPEVQSVTRPHAGGTFLVVDDLPGWPKIAFLPKVPWVADDGPSVGPPDAGWQASARPRPDYTAAGNDGPSVEPQDAGWQASARPRPDYTAAGSILAATSSSRNCCSVSSLPSS